MKHKNQMQKEENQKKSHSSHASCFMIHASCPRGFAVAFSVIVGGLMVAVGLAAWSIGQKEALLTGISRESGEAFGAADAGWECALYWDLNNAGAFAEPARVPGSSSVWCAGAWRSVAVSPPASTVPPGCGIGTVCTSTFFFPVGGGCSLVKVVKDTSGRTTVDARGTNTACGSGGPTLTPQTIERGIRFSYF